MNQIQIDPQLDEVVGVAMGEAFDKYPLGMVKGACLMHACMGAMLSMIYEEDGKPDFDKVTVVFLRLMHYVEHMGKEGQGKLIKHLSGTAAIEFAAAYSKTVLVPLCEEAAKEYNRDEEGPTP